MARVRALTGQVERRLDTWEMALTPAGACAGPAEAARLRDWIPASAPGTAAQALAAADRWRADAPEPLHEKDVWWRTILPAGGPRILACDGLATLAEAWLGETPLFASRSMFQPRTVELPAIGETPLWICFRALAPVLAAAKGPRARWRPQLIEGQGLRLLRTTLLGHMPGWQPRIDIVGPWRAIRLIEPGPLRLGRVSLRPTLEADGPRLAAEVAVDGTEAAPVLSCGGAEARIEPLGGGRFAGVLPVAGAEPWFPHTHGRPALHPVRLRIGGTEADLGRTGFRRIEVDRGADGQGFGLKVNGTPVFCRGACWVQPDLIGLGGAREDYQHPLSLACAAGMNMVRLSGAGVYESPALFELCDELGLMVWQDFMFANFDYPVADPAFAAAARAEAEARLMELEASPALAVLCGGSEVMQQAAMLGLAPGALDWPLFEELLPEVCARIRPDVPYLPNTPFGGALPFEAGRGVAHYYGVGAFRRPLEDARRAEVRFAAECLAFANVPAAESLDAPGAPALHDPRWKARTPRDRGASWDFEDVRDHYLADLFGVDAAGLRRDHPELYLDLSRAVTGEAMAATFAEWRRARSPCRGGLVWLLQDGQLGAGWGLVDAAGRPKAAWWALRRVLQPRQVLLTDEGVNGLAVHLINETPDPFRGELRLAVPGETPGPFIEALAPIELPSRSVVERNAFEVSGRFFDLTWAYRFGPRSHVAVSAQLRAPGGETASEAVYIPPGVRGWEPAGEASAELVEDAKGWRLRLCAERLQRFVQLADPAFRPDDDGFVLLPGETREIRLAPAAGASAGARPEGWARAPGGRALARWRG